MTCYWNRLNELTGQQVYDVFLLRQQVFVIEQECLYPDIDNVDLDAHHCRYFIAGRLAGYLRLIPPSANELPAIGRVAVSRKYRKQGIAELMMQSAIERSGDLYPGNSIRLAAQTYLIEFYARLEFTPVGGSYIEDGIPHQDMVRSVRTRNYPAS